MVILELIRVYGPFIAMGLIFYFMLWRPQKKREKNRQDMLSKLHKGNRVLTVGGFYGEIVEIKDNVVKLKLADKVIVEVARSAIGSNVSQGIATETMPLDIEDNDKN